VVQLEILSGKRAGTVFRPNQFPIRAGREPGLAVPLEEEGVWPRHFIIDCGDDGLIVEAEPQALLDLNGTPAQRAVLRNGDVITVGMLKIRFSLSPVQQSSLALGEWMTWAALAALCVGQVALVYWLVL
jgi:hypothetical protein